MGTGFKLCLSQAQTVSQTKVFQLSEGVVDGSIKSMDEESHDILRGYKEYLVHDFIHMLVARATFRYGIATFLGCKGGSHRDHERNQYLEPHANKAASSSSFFFPLSFLNLNL